jgi:hypothetical protein
MQDGEERRDSLRRIAFALADAGQMEQGLTVARYILHDREMHFPILAEAFAHHRNRTGVKAMLPLCAEHPWSAIRVVASLIRVYPEEASRILDAAWPYLSPRSKSEHASLGRGKEGVQELPKVSRRPGRDEANWRLWGLMQLSLGKEFKYGDICRAALAEYLPRETAWQVDQLVQLCVLAPLEQGALRSLAFVVERVFEAATTADALGLHGALLFRLDQREAARSKLERAAQSEMNARALMIQFFLAMLDAKEGRIPSAHERLARCSQCLAGDSEALTWDERLTLELLQKEAGALLFSALRQTERDSGKLFGAARAVAGVLLRLFLNNVCRVPRFRRNLKDNTLYSPYLAGFKRLDLSRLQLADASLALIPEDVTELALVDVPISDGGVRHLCRLTNLERLNLAGTRITDAGLDSLACLNKLIWLSVERTAMTTPGIGRLKTSSPGIEIVC